MRFVSQCQLDSVDRRPINRVCSAETTAHTVHVPLSSSNIKQRLKLEGCKQSYKTAAVPTASNCGGTKQIQRIRGKRRGGHRHCRRGLQRDCGQFLGFVRLLNCFNLFVYFTFQQQNSYIFHTQTSQIKIKYRTKTHFQSIINGCVIYSYRVFSISIAVKALMYPIITTRYICL